MEKEIGLKVFGGIIEQLYNIHDTKEESYNEVLHYRREFRGEPDYNIASYGCLLVYYIQVRRFYKECGFPVEKFEDDELWEQYKKDVGASVDALILLKEGACFPIKIAGEQFFFKSK